MNFYPRIPSIYDYSCGLTLIKGRTLNVKLSILKLFYRWFKYRRNGIKVWWPCNIYPTAHIGKNCSIGMFTEIGDGVRIGNNVRIGKGVFIPAGVIIGDGAFIGPHVCFSNDTYPPAAKEEWKRTVVGIRASIGATASIRPGAHIGNGALVGMGAVVTCVVPDNEIWAGVPAKMIRRK